MSFDKTGIISSGNIYESSGTNLLVNSEKYTANNPYILTGNGSDLYKATDQYCRVIPGKTYYYLSQTDAEWSSKHTNTGSGQVTIWLYLLKEYNTSNLGWDSAMCFTSSNWVTKGIWKYTIPDGYNMVRVRYNSYSDNTTTITKKFWDTKLIPSEYFVSTPFENSALHISNNFLSTGEIVEY